MDYNASFQISATGMAVEKLRIDVTAANLANIHSSAASGNRLYQPMRVISREIGLAFGQHFDNLKTGVGGVEATGLAPLDVAPRRVYEPGHPHADARGFVAYPGINQTAEMVNLTTALRAYEANVVAMNAAKTMTARTLEIGGQS